MKHENLSRARNQHKIPLHYIKSTHQLSFRNINLKWTTIQWAIGPQYHKGIVAKPGTSLLIIHSLTHRGPVDLRKWAFFNTILMSPKSWLSQEDLDAGCEHSLVPMNSKGS